MPIDIIEAIETSLSVALGHTLPFKDTLEELILESSETYIESDAVPKGEVWEITTIFCQTSGASGDIKIAKKLAAISYKIKQVTNIWLDWSGVVILKESQKIGANLPSGNLQLQFNGVKRFSPDVIAEEFHKIQPITLPEDLQQPKEKAWWWPF